MSRKLITLGPRHDEVSAGEILVGLAWTVLYIALIGSGWARDALMLVAERGLPSLF